MYGVVVAGRAHINILLVASSIGGGGAERVAVNLAAQMVDLGHEVGIFYWDEKDGENYELDARLKLYKSASRLFPLRTRNLRLLLKTLTVDVIIGFTDMPNITVWAALLGFSNPPAFIATVHSDLRTRDASAGLSGKTRFLRFLHKQACADAGKVVVVSDGARDSLISYYKLQSGSVQRIYNPVLLEAKSPAVRPLDRPSLKFIAAGRLTQAKDYPVMIQAVKLLTNRPDLSFHLDIYGAGELKEQLQALIDEQNLSAQITLRGFTRNLPEKLIECDVFLQSSRWEGFGNVLVEALHAGLKVVVTDCPSGPREILADGKFGLLVPPGDSLALANAIVQTLHRPQVIDRYELQEHLIQFTAANVAAEYLYVALELVSPLKACDDV